jgi:hypothetical protein
MEATFQVVFRGKLLSGFNAEQVASNLATLFKTDTARAAGMLAQPKWVVKVGLSKDAAQRYQEALRAAGMMVAVIQDEPAAAAPAPTQATSPAPPAVVTIASAVLGTPPAAATSEATTDAPLEAKARPPVFNPDLSAYSLAEPGVVLIDVAKAKVAPVQIDTNALSLAELGVVLAQAPKVKPLQMDLSALSVAPIEQKAETGPSRLDLAQ